MFNSEASAAVANHKKGRVPRALRDELAAERFHTVEAIAALLRNYAPDAEPTRISAYANLISGAAEQLGRWWLYNRHVSRETISRYQADFLWSGGRELRDDAPA